MAEIFDHIVIGAGSAGCTIAARLAEAGRKVLLIEAGGPARGRRFLMPAALRSLWEDPAIGWSYQTEPEPGLDGRRVAVPRGRVLGGCSAINGMIATRGSRLDYDGWAAAGLDGWSYEHVLPYFRRSESHWLGAGPYHGDAGPLPVSRHAPRFAASEILSAALRERGYRPSDDFSGATSEGFGQPSFTTRHARRVSIADAYLPRAPGLRIASRAHVTRLLVEHGRTVGALYVQDGASCEVRADGDLILCAGALNSPQLLLLSGIGPAEALRALDIPVLLDQPGIGRDLEDQPVAPFAVPAREPFSFNPMLRADRLAGEYARWLRGQDGFLSAPPMYHFLIARSDPTLTHPDLRIMFTGPLDSQPWFPGWRRPANPALTVIVSLCYPLSRGSLTLRSADPFASPAIAYGLYDRPEDLAAMRKVWRQMRAVLDSAALAPFIDLARWKDPADEDAHDRLLRAATTTTQHPIGSCRMGAGNDAPVDEALRLRGVDGLRVVDASVFPTQIGGNPNLPIVMMAERLSDFLLDRATLPAAAPTMPAAKAA